MTLLEPGLRGASGRHHTGRAWLGPLTDVDRRVLRHAVGPVLDVGCGPGRHTLELATRGLPALGIDITPSLIERARALGAPVLHRDVFGRVPGEGRWGTVMLLDGNLGLGGDPARLLTRAAGLVRPDGRVIVELVPVAPPADAVRVDLGDGRTGPWFTWAPIDGPQLAPLASRSGLTTTRSWRDGGREFAILEPRLPPQTHRPRQEGVPSDPVRPAPAAPNRTTVRPEP